jgi:hypothetical protein
MSIFFKPGLGQRAKGDSSVAVAQIRDYAERGLALGAQRLLIFAVALVLQAFYLGAEFVAISTVLIIISETFDGRTFRQGRNLREGDQVALRSVLRRIHLGAVYGAAMISFFALSIAFAQVEGDSFIPMFLSRSL